MYASCIVFVTAWIWYCVFDWDMGKDKIKLWINNNIKITIKHKQKLFMLTKQNSTPNHIYNHYRNIVNSEVGGAKKNVYKERFVGVVGNKKMYYRQ